ncbi:hypothetical protein ABZ547_08350 [Streptomyces sparsogenes]|uniref:hypothetical protein n=1 Tax=Streptomyces sparsogenes TaxID=67365 RepID=UPI0033C3F5A0
MPPTTVVSLPRIGDYVEIVQATHAATGVRGRLTHTDDADPVDRYRIHCDGGLVAWATQIRPVPSNPNPAPAPEGSSPRARRRRNPTT